MFAEELFLLNIDPSVNKCIASYKYGKLPEKIDQKLCIVLAKCPAPPPPSLILNVY